MVPLTTAEFLTTAVLIAVFLSLNLYFLYMVYVVGDWIVERKKGSAPETHGEATGEPSSPMAGE